MARLYRPRIIRYLDKATGRRCPKGTPGAVKRTVRSKTWRGEYRDGDNVLRTAKLHARKDLAEMMLADLVRKADRQRAGIADPAEEAAKTPLLTHLSDFRQHLEDKGSAERHARMTETRVRAVIDGCGFVRVRDVNADAVESWLANRVAADEFGVSTRNGYLVAIKSFCNWLVKTRRRSDNPLSHLARLNPAADVRVVRRAADPDELARLLDAARVGEPFRGLSGEDRAMLYCVAIETGLRVGELASLTVASLELDGEVPTVTVEAAYSKRRRNDRQPIRTELAARLKTWLKRRNVASEGVVKLPDPEARLWPGPWHEVAAKMLRRDLKAARNAWLEETKDPKEIKRRDESDFLAFENSAGRRLDFHSLRATFATSLARAGVSPQSAQRLMRHSDINLTVRHYTHLTIRDQADDLDRLPPMPESAVPNVATGTDGRGVVAGMVAGPSEDRGNSVRTRDDSSRHITRRAASSNSPENAGNDDDCELVRAGEKEWGCSDLNREPTDYECTDASPEGETGKDLRQTRSDGCRFGCRTSHASAPADADLDRLIAAWPTLPPALKNAVLAIVDSTRPAVEGA